MINVFFLFFFALTVPCYLSVSGHLLFSILFSILFYLPECFQFYSSTSRCLSYILFSIRIFRLSSLSLPFYLFIQYASVSPEYYLTRADMWFDIWVWYLDCKIWCPDPPRELNLLTETLMNYLILIIFLIIGIGL